MGPRRLRARALRRDAVPQRWLTTAAQAEVTRQRVEQHLDEPLSWRRSTRRLAHRRGWVHGAATLQQIAGLRDVTLHHPLLHPTFLDAFAANGSVVGPVTRAAAMRDLFGDLLPDEVLRRRSKATFNTTLFGAHSRSFAAGWTGHGVDRALVDAEELAATWRDDVPDGSTFALLQSAWLAARRGPDAGPAHLPLA